MHIISHHSSLYKLSSACIQLLHKIVTIFDSSVLQHGSVPLYWHCLILSTGGVGDGDIVAQDGYPLQSEGRTPGDEDSDGVDGHHSEVTDGIQLTCKLCINISK